MRRTNILFGAGALLVAAGSIGAGVMVSTNAMAASGDLGPNALTIGMVTVGSNGDAYQCTFDAASVPGVAGPAAVGTGGPAVAGGAMTVPVGDPTAGAVIVSASGSVSVPADGSVPPALPVPEGAGVITVQGAVTADGASLASQINADGSVTPVKVRQGTAAECAAAKQGIVPPSGGQPASASTGNAPTDTVVNPKG